MNSEELLERINEASKYEAVPRYHTYSTSQRRMLDRVVVDFEQAQGLIYVTEALNGVGVRIILPPKTHGTAYYLASRRVLLTSAGDLIYNPLKGIVPVLRPIADELIEDHDTWFDHRQGWTVIYGDIIGPGFSLPGNGEARDYYLSLPAFYAYDVATFPESVLLSKTVSEIAEWHEQGGPQYMAWGTLGYLLPVTLGVPVAPTLGVLEGPATMPHTPEATSLWMEAWSQSGVTEHCEAFGVTVRSDRPRLLSRMTLREYRTVPVGM